MASGYFAEDSKSFGRFKYWLEGQQRLGDDSSRFTQSLIRPGIGYDLTDNTSLWLGYAWIMTRAPLTTNPFEENQIWQQLLWVKSMDYLTLRSRTRTEQRFFRNATVGYRIRQLAKFSVPLKSSKFSLVAFDECFWNLNRNDKGFRQNRAFVGLGYHFNSTITGEFGFMNQYIFRNRIPNFSANILFLSIIMNT